jgi:hypothetical protein
MSMPTFDSVRVTGNAEVEGDFQVDKNQTVLGDFQVNGSQTVSGNFQVDGSQTVQQQLAVGGAVSVIGTTTLGASGTPIVTHLSATTTLAWLVPFAANSSLIQTVFISGVAFGDNVYASPEGGLGPQFVWVAYVSAANTVAIQVANISTIAGISAPTAFWHIDVWKH